MSKNKKKVISKAKKSAISPKKKAKKTPPPKSKSLKARSESKVVTKKIPQRAPVKSTPPDLKVVPMPSRAPVRKVFGAGKEGQVFVKSNVAIAVSTPQIELSPPTLSPTSAPNTTPPLAVRIDEPRRLEPVADLPKIPWTALSKNLPPLTSFLTRMTYNECNSAEGSIFAFAKFLSSLPKEVCGEEFALMLLALEHSVETIARMCNMSVDAVEARLDSGSIHINECFTSSCPDMSRKWRTQLSGKGMSIENLMEPYLVSKVDRSFQLMVGSVLLVALKRIAELQH